MLEQMRITGLGVIADAVLDLHPGLTVLTGETGAGKTMVLTGLSLLLGGKGEASLVRAGEDACTVEGVWQLAADAPAVLRSLDAGADVDDGALVLARRVGTSGRTRAHVGGRTVPTGVLAELGEHLVTVHGQHDTQRLTRPSEQRVLLDRAAGHDALLASWAQAFTAWRDLAQQRDELVREARARRQEGEVLRLGLERVATVDPQPGEDVALAEESLALERGEDVRAALTQALAGVSGEEGDDAVTALASARRALAAVAHLTPALTDIARQLDDAAAAVSAVASELASAAGDVSGEPGRLDEVQERRSRLTRLTRTYGDGDVDSVLRWAATAATRLAELDGDEDRVSELQTRHAALTVELAARASTLRSARVVAALALGTAVTAELAALAMGGATVGVTVRPRPAGADRPTLVVDGEPCGASASGTDDVEVWLAAHPGAAPLPIGRGASGGERSRVMLALEVVLAGGDPVPTMVFDEVDAGVGGAAAVAVGRTLARVARDHQVVVVTHLAQVAAFADRQLVVTRHTGSDSVTRTGVVEVTGDARLAELARMLGGDGSSDVGRAHADELLTSARALV